MAYNSSPSGSQSPLSEVSSMPSAGRLTPVRVRLEAPRVASKGGCWYVPLSTPIHLLNQKQNKKGPVAFAEK